MTHPENPDKPAFDLAQFEAEAQDRAAEFIAQVSRLAVIGIPIDTPIDTLDSWLAERGAQYCLAGNTRIEVKHEVHGEPDHVIAKARITHPATEILGSDGELRRVTLTRFVMCQSFTPDIEGDADVSPDPELEEDARAGYSALERERLKHQLELDSDYRPRELVSARTTVHVERQLPGKPNFRTEHYSDNMPAATKSAHVAARRRAGEPAENPEYGIPEHQALIARLAGIDPVTADPQPLEDDFSGIGVWEWSLSAAARSWIPSKTQE